MKLAHLNSTHLSKNIKVFSSTGQVMISGMLLNLTAFLTWDGIRGQGKTGTKPVVSVLLRLEEGGELSQKFDSDVECIVEGLAETRDTESLVQDSILLNSTLWRLTEALYPEHVIPGEQEQYLVDPEPLVTNAVEAIAQGRTFREAIERAREETPGCVCEISFTTVHRWGGSPCPVHQDGL